MNITSIYVNNPKANVSFQDNSALNTNIYADYRWKIKQTGIKTSLFFLLLLFCAFAKAQTTYYLKTASQAAANTVTNWNTDATGAGGGTNASVFTNALDTWVILSSQNAVFATGTSTTFAGTVQVDGTLKVASASANSNTTVTVNGAVLCSNASTTQITCTSASGGGTNTFALGTSATFKTNSTAGILGTNCAIGLNTNRAAQTLPTTSNYEFNGSVQSTTGLPATVNNLTFSNSNTKTVAGAVSVSAILTIASGVTVNMGANALSGATLTTSGTGILQTQNTTSTPVPAGRTWTTGVQYNTTTGAQTVMAGTYNDLTLSNTGGTQTASGNLVVNGTLITTSGGTLAMGTTAILSGTLATINNGGTISTAVQTATSATPIPSGKTWGGTVTYAATAGAQTVVAAISYNNLSQTNTSGTNTTAGDLVVNGTLTTTSGGTLAMGTTAILSGILGTITNGGTISTAVPTASSTTPIPPGKIWGGTITYAAIAGAQTIVAAISYNNLFQTNTSGINTAGGNLVVNGTLTTTSGGTLDMGTTAILSGSLTTITNGGTISTAVPTATSAIPVPSGKTWGGTINYAATAGAQTVVTGTYNNLTLSNTSGTNTAGGSLVVNGTLTIGSGGTLNMGTTATLTGTLGSVTNGGTITTLVPTATSATPLATGKTWTGTIVYAATAGAQTVVSGTYNNLTLSNTSGTNAASGALTVNGTLVTTSGGILNMGTNQLLGTLTTITNDGTIQTQNTGLVPIPTGNSWGGTIQYNATTGAQTVMAGTYNNLTLSNTSGTQIATSALTVNGTLITTSGGTLNMVTNQLSGTLSIVTNGGTVRTQNTSATPFPSGINWNGTVQYDGGNQTVIGVNYATLIFGGTGSKTLAGAIAVSSDLSIVSGVNASLGTFTSSSNTLTLNTLGQPAGSWGGTGSGATFINTTYFAAASGILNVASSSCSAGTWIGLTSTDWFDVTNWCTGSIPTAATNVTIPSGGNQPVISTSGAVCNNITIGSGATLTITGSNTFTVSGSWTRTGTFTANTSAVDFNGSGAASIGVSNFNNVIFSGAGTKTATGILTVDGNITISNNFTSGVFTHAVAGDWTNNGIFTGTGSTINFNGNNALQTVGGSSTTTFNLLVVTKTSQSNMLEVTSNIGLAAGGLTLTSGTFKLSGTGTITNTFFNTAAYSIPVAAGFWLNNSNATVTGQNGSPTWAGLFRVSNGIYNIGTGTTSNSMGFNSGAIITVEGGIVRANARFAVSTAANTTTFNQSGGTIYVNTATTTNSSGTLFAFDMGTSTSSSFTMSGGTIVIRGASTGIADDYRGPASGATVSITGGTLQIGTAAVTTPAISATPASTTIFVQGVMPGLSVNTTNGPTARLTATSTLNGSVAIGPGATFNAGSFNFSLTGDWTNSGTFTPGTQTVTFNKPSATQTITKTGGETFSSFTINKTSGSVVMGNNLTVPGLLNLTSGSLSVNGNTLNLSGTATTTTGTVTVVSGTVNFNGASAQSIPSGFFTSNAAANLVIANTAGVTFNGSVAVSGNFTVNASSIFTPASGVVISGAGTLQGISNITSVAQVTRSTGTSDFLSQYTITNKTLTNLLIEFAGTAAQGVAANTFTALKISNSNGVTMGADVTTTTLNLNSGNLLIGANTLTINGGVSRTSGNLAGGNTSNLTIGGVAGSLFFDNSSINNFLKTLTINTMSSATLGNALNITAYDGIGSEGVLAVSGTGVLTTGGFLSIKSNANGTARIGAGNTAGGYISGDVSVERFIVKNSSKGWRLLASTTSGQTINAAWQEGAIGGMVNPNPGFGTKISSSGANLGAVQALGFDTLSPGKSIFKYNPATDVLDFVPNTNGTQLSSEQGYFLFVRGDRSPGQFGAGAPTTSTVLRSKGTLFLGDQSVVATGASNYGLVRNPYPSRIDMRYIVRGSNLIDAYQVWDAKLGGTFGVGGFQTFTKSGANYVIAPGGGSYATIGSTQNFIESGAAFYIQSVSNTNNTAQVTEACKTSGSTNNSYRPSGVLAEDKRLSFSLYAINPGSTDGVDGGLIFFNDTYSNAVDINDVRKSGNFSENFGILRDNIELVVERRKDVAANDTIFFKMYQLRQISYRIDLANIGFDPAVTTVVLQDKFTGTNTTLNLAGVTSYTFAVSGVAGTFATDRFKLVLSSGNTFSGTGNWTDNARWSKGTPAVSGENVTIAAGANATLNTDFTVGGSLTMTPASTLVINPTKTLSISGTADLAGQLVTFKSDNTGYGSLGQLTGILNGATNVTVERYVPNNGFRSWRLLSVPTYASGQTIRQAWQEGVANPLPLQNNVANFGTQITGVFALQATAAAAGFDSTSVTASLLTWNGTGWSNVTNTNQPIANSKAYFMFVRGERSKGVTGAVTNSSATTLRTNGTVYTGNQVFNVSTGGFAVAANLYPSAINFTGLTRSNVNNLFYTWDSKKQNGNSLGVYQTFSSTNSFNCLIGGGSYTLGQPNTTIESGQGFFVSGGLTTGGGTITLLESAKVSGTNGNLGFRPSAFPAKIDSRLLGVNNEVLDANVVVFDNAYNREVDADDAVKFGNPGANFAIETGSKILAIEGTQPVTDKDIIQFRMWNLKQQDYKLQFTTGNMNVQGLYAILEDRYLSTSEEINLTGETIIAFKVDADPASSTANRFRMLFSKNKPATVTVIPTYTIAPNPVEGKSVNLVFKNQPMGKYNIKIVGIDGKAIALKVISHPGGNSNQLIALPSRIAGGTYQLEITAPDNSTTLKQLLVKSML